MSVRCGPALERLVAKLLGYLDGIGDCQLVLLEPIAHPGIL